MFLVNSRSRPFTAAPNCSASKSRHNQGHPFFRSYRASLPSSLTRVLSRTLGFSPCPPVSVYGTGTIQLPRGFSWQHGNGHFATITAAPHHFSGLRQDGFAYPVPLPAWPRSTNHAVGRPFCVPPSVIALYRGAGIWTGCPSPTAFALGLGPAKLKRTNLA